MYLIGDIGNTEIKICLFDGDLKLVKKKRLLTDKINSYYLKKNLVFLSKCNDQIKKTLISSVVPKSYKLISKFLKKNFNIQCIELKSLNLRKLVDIKVNKKQIGSDRLANAISVIDNKNNYIIVDFGTATNFDVVIKNKYIGGILAPGVQLSLKTLIDKASLIPEIKLDKINNVIGKNTKSAIRSGLYYGYSGLIDDIVNLIIKQTRKKYNLILTGGYSYLFKKSLKGKAKIVKNLTINGILKAAIKS